MTEYKVYTMEFVRKHALWKIIENTPPEYERMENAHPGK